MNRRAIIRQLFFVGGGIWLFPSCLGSNNRKKTMVSEVNRQQERLLADVVEAIIPATDTPGAKALGIHLFAIKMVRDCRPIEYQELFWAGLGKLDGYSMRKIEKRFSDSTDMERASILGQVRRDETAGEALKAFVSVIRELTIHGYKNSEYVMTNLLPYRLVPGPFRGCVPAKQYQGKKPMEAA